MENLHKLIAAEINKASQKQTWSTPAVEDLYASLIRQQEEELLQLLTDENAFRLLSGSLT